MRFNKYLIIALSAVSLASCQDDPLEKNPTGELSSELFWKTEDDIISAEAGMMSDVRYLFDRDYYLDGMGEYVHMYGNSFMSNNGNNGRAYMGRWDYQPWGFGGYFENMYKYCYGGINRANYVIENGERMLAKAPTPEMEQTIKMVLAESRMMRALIYFRLITWWGDVPYFEFVPGNPDQMANMERRPISEIRDHILDDLQYAIDNLPDKAASLGHFGKPAAYALRGKVNLYWASWNHFGWPELDTFTPSEEEAQKAYLASAEDFRVVIEDFGLTLFRNGEPGECDPPGECDSQGNCITPGRADNLPNYYYMFLPTANGDDEFVLAFTHGGTSTSQGEQLMRDFAGRNIQYSQGWVVPRQCLADRYQSTITGEFCEPLVRMDPSQNPAARTAANSAVNPQSYANRDYRMKSTLLWDFELSMGMASLKETGWNAFVYKKWGTTVKIGDVTYPTYENINAVDGYNFRKFVRNYAGQDRTDGDFNWPVIRLGDVYLMYAEADNFAHGPRQKAIDLVNKIRHRGNLPALKGDKTANKEAFFNAIKQERVVELVAEGHRVWDMRRWREMEDIYGGVGGPGYKWYDTYGAEKYKFWDNATTTAYQRCYIFQIPESERNKNPYLTQNLPWR